MKRINRIFIYLTFCLSISENLSSQTYDYRRELVLKENFYPFLLVNYNYNNNNNCKQNSGIVSNIKDWELNNAFRKATQQINEVLTNNTKYLEINSDLKEFDPYIYHASLQAKYNAFASKNLILSNCLSRYEAELKLKKFRILKNYSNGINSCDIESEVSPTVKCDPKYKYSRIDGKCNNLVKTNWGSRSHCHRRLLLPDYADGVGQLRVASDGSALPDARLISNVLMPRNDYLDPERSSMHMEWGQFVAHDFTKTLQHFGNTVGCCTEDSELVNQDCMATWNFPPDAITTAYNQSCITLPLSIGCNTCSLGHREQINLATSTLDLSNFYGGNVNNTKSLRSYRRGTIKSGTALDGTDILPKARLPEDQDHFELATCNNPPDQPWLSCFVTGDGSRGNQQPMIASMHLVMQRRHNQHSIALSKVNPHWDDETLFQEARRLLIAEVSKIHFSEYFPSVLNNQTLDYFELNVKSNGFTQYNPNVNPTSINEVSGAAFRFGHSQVNTQFQVIKKPKYKTYGFKLRFKYQEMSDIWEGNANGIIDGLTRVPARAVDPYSSPDVHDYLLFRVKEPGLQDLKMFNIIRGRDHGIPGYVYFVEYCTGVRIKSWTDLNQFIPEVYVKSLSKVYKDVRDVDLFVGGLAEKHLNGSILGPTFSCLIGIQAYHWKWGDRFYFEHGGQVGSFTPEQLNNIRTTASLANLLCKTTDLESIQSKPMFMPSNTNPMIRCQHLPEFDYNLWREK